MKKLIIVLVLLLAATALFGQIKMGNSFPSAKFLDAQNNAVWEFSADNIKIWDSKTGDLAWDFANKTIQDFKTSADGRQVIVTFSCPEAERSYAFRTNLPDADITMEISRTDLPKYTVKMPKQ
jgi:ABC-type glycerol-3-phosphate transport system substrate-binding protein